MITPARTGAAASQLMVEVTDIGHLVIAELTQVVRERNNRESVWIGSRAGLVIAIGINHRQTFMHEVVGVVQLAMRNAAQAMVLVLRELHPLVRAKSADVSLIESRE